MKIKSFGQGLDNPPSEYWYELSDGTRVQCDEETIMKLWCDWVLNKNENSKRADNGKYNIFEYIEPIEINLNTLEDWTTP